MKAILTLLQVWLLGVGANAHAQILSTNHGVIEVQNTLSQAEVVKLVSHLHVGIKEEDCTAFLWTNKLASALSVGSITGWDAVYPLSNGCSLHLKYSARSIRANGRWGGDGSLVRAFIQSNDVNILSIPLRDTPESNGEASRRQSVGSETNKTSTSAGSGR